MGLGVDVEKVAPQQIACGWTHNGCCVEDPWGETDHRKTDRAQACQNYFLFPGVSGIKDAPIVLGSD